MSLIPGLEYEIEQWNGKCECTQLQLTHVTGIVQSKLNYLLSSLERAGFMSINEVVHVRSSISKHGIVANSSSGAYGPINGMPHLAYLGQMLEKGGGFAVRIFPRGWYLVANVPIAYIFSFVVFKHLWNIPGEFHRYQYLPVTHCA